MGMEVIRSLSNSNIKEYASLRNKKYRDQKQLFLAEGEHLCEEAYHAGILKRAVVSERKMGVYPYDDILYVTDEVMKKLTDTVSSSDIVGICSFPTETDIIGKKVLILDGVQDPGNLGTLIRTALSFGFADVFCSSDSADLYNEKVLRSTQGSSFRIRYRRTDLLKTVEKLKKEGYAVYGTSLQNGIALSSFEKTEKVAVILGNEGNGVRKKILDMCDKNIYVEMETFESLNVAVAGGIIMYHFR